RRAHVVFGLMLLLHPEQHRAERIRRQEKQADRRQRGRADGQDRQSGEKHGQDRGERPRRREDEDDREARVDFRILYEAPPALRMPDVLAEQIARPDAVSLDGDEDRENSAQCRCDWVESERALLARGAPEQEEPELDREQRWEARGWLGALGERAD